MSKLKFVAALAFAAGLTGCASNPTTLEIVGSPPASEVQASCEDGGVVALVVGFSDGADSESMLVGTGPGVEAMGGVPEYDWAFSLDESQTEAAMSVTAGATSGTCTVRVGDLNSDQSLERTVSGDDELQWLITFKQS